MQISVVYMKCLHMYFALLVVGNGSDEQAHFTAEGQVVSLAPHQTRLAKIPTQSFSTLPSGINPEIKLILS